ncbi:MAG: hypothetical protein K2X27_25380 [Candidatus Obscuribacterales bacterium]|nr:hypothetical protein [Candidatus Obscuribacterales bacterium]
MRVFSTLFAVLCALQFTGPAIADDGADWMNDGKELPKGVVSNDDSMISKDSTSFSLAVQAERALKSGKANRAIELARRSLDMNDDDMDTHLVYAKALEKKLVSQQTEDPMLFNLCVKEWLSVLRNSYGDEKGTHFQGLALPGFGGKFYEDEDRQGLARQHLVKLTGACPKVWETNEKYLQKVQRHGETTVSAKLVGEAAKDGNQAPAGKTQSSKSSASKQSLH